VPGKADVKFQSIRVYQMNKKETKGTEPHSFTISMVLALE